MILKWRNQQNFTPTVYEHYNSKTWEPESYNFQNSESVLINDNWWQFLFVAGAKRLSYLNQICLKNSTSSSTTSESTRCAMDNEMHLRRLKIATMCQWPNSSLPDNIDFSHLWVMRYRQLVWCPVYKAASTNWMKNIVELSNFKANDIRKLKKIFRQPNELGSFMAPPMNRTDFLTYLKSIPSTPVSFLIVRHPFDRLLSAYRDKLERYNKHFDELYGKRIVEKYRPRGILRFGKEFYDHEVREGRRGNDNILE